ncbi:MAG: heavy-metal-associated domain-containing protein [Flavobacteriales bacterium]
MKLNQKIIYLLVVVIFGSCNNGTLNTKSEFKVWGNCSMCKKTIENALDVNGVIEADWNKDTKMMKVSYDSTLIKLDALQQLIVQAGYDTEKYTAEQSTYNSLHECCQYERKP